MEGGRQVSRSDVKAWLKNRYSESESESEGAKAKVRARARARASTGEKCHHDSFIFDMSHSSLR